MKILIFLALPVLLAGAAAQEPRDIGSRKQLFIDRRFMAGSQGVVLRMNPPVKQGMVIRGTHTWENGIIATFGSVLEYGGKYRMWYMASPVTTAGYYDEVYRMCYAESADGLTWTKPNLGLYEWEGSKANNICMACDPESAGVFVDPKAPPAERYKLVGHVRAKPREGAAGPEGNGLYMYTSPDGWHWTFHPRRVFPFFPDTLNVGFYDESKGKYLAYVRTWNPMRRVGVVVMDDIMQPWPYDRRPVPSAKVHFNPPTTQLPDAFGVDAGDPPNIDHYTSATVRYRWAADAYLMFPSAYRHFPDPPEGAHRNDGTLDIQMAVSRDGLKFRRLARAPYLGVGEEGSRDSHRVYMLVGLIRRGPALYQYYSGHHINHGGYGGAGVKRDWGGIFLARQRLDGFVSADADEAGGWLATPPLRFAGSHLVLNLDAGGTGEIRVEIRGTDGRPIPGYAFADCDPVILNDTARTVTWRRGQADVGSLAGQPVRVAFRLRSAKLYSFQFAK